MLRSISGIWYAINILRVILFTLSFLIVYAIPRIASATIVNATITGTISWGTDQGTNNQGAFGPAGSLVGKSATLIFSFDDTKGQQSTDTQSGVPYLSEIVTSQNSNPGSVSISIEGTTLQIPISGDTNAYSEAKRIVSPGTNELYFLAQSWQGGSESSVQADVGPGSGPKHMQS